MMWLKACPRCRGDVALDLDRWGWYRFCVQCGWQEDLVPVAALPVKKTA